MNKFPTIENFLENAFEHEDLNELLRYIKDISDGRKNKPLNIYGDTNCGKTALAGLLKTMFMDNAVIMSSCYFISSFNNLWAEKRLVILDECRIDGRTGEKIIKTYHSDFIHVETKGQESREVFNNITFIIFTNIPMIKHDDINAMEMRVPISYNSMVAELPEFTEYVKHYQP